MSAEELDDEVTVETPAPAPPKAPTAKFGWCITNQHRECPREVGKGVCHCDCPDHGVDYVPSTEDPLSPALRAIATRYA